MGASIFKGRCGCLATTGSRPISHCACRRWRSGEAFAGNGPYMLPQTLACEAKSRRMPCA